MKKHFIGDLTEVEFPTSFVVERVLNYDWEYIAVSQATNYDRIDNSYSDNQKTLVVFQSLSEFEKWLKTESLDY